MNDLKGKDLNISAKKEKEECEKKECKYLNKMLKFYSKK